MSDHSYVNQVARQSGSNFYYSFLSLPKHQREAITAVYAFCREVDDAVDLSADQAGAPGAGDPGVILAAWRQELDRTYEGKPSRPLTLSLREAIDHFQLSREYFDGILEGVGMDLAKTRYATFDELAQYCYHVAGEVGLLCMEIFGYRSERLKKYAVNLGTAFQLTNILRDIKSDAERGRIYLPQDDLARFGVPEQDILGQRSSPAFIRLMTFEASRARSFYREAAVAPTVEERPALRAAEIMRAVYENLLNRIERSNYQVFGPRLHVPAVIKIALALKTYWECRR